MEQRLQVHQNWSVSRREFSFDKVVTERGRFPAVIHSESSPNCLFWRMLVDFQATNSSGSTWHAVELWVLAARLLCLAKASRLLASFQLAWWRVENLPQACISNPKYPAAHQTKLWWTVIWVCLFRCTLRYFLASRILSIPAREDFCIGSAWPVGAFQGWLLWGGARSFPRVHQNKSLVAPKMAMPLVKAGSIRNGDKVPVITYLRRK